MSSDSDVLVCVFHCTESDPDAVYSAVKTGDVSYGEIIIKDKKKQTRMRGTAALLCFHHGSWFDFP